MIEIEKKFILTPEQESALINDANFIEEKEFTDIYYDDEYFSLTTKDIWLRERAGKFELKVPLAKLNENRVVDRYQELENEIDILKFFHSSESSIQDFLLKNYYKEFCRIVTKRKKYKIDNFGMDIDTMDFGYSLVELEVMIDSESKIQKATESIIDFAKKYNININAKVLGKVIEYLRLKNPKHLQAMVKAGVVKL